MPVTLFLGLWVLWLSRRIIFSFLSLVAHNICLQGFPDFPFDRKDGVYLAEIGSLHFEVDFQIIPGQGWSGGFSWRAEMGKGCVRGIKRGMTPLIFTNTR